MSRPDPRRIVAFWRAAGTGRWFRRDDAFDTLVRLRLGRAQALAAQGMLDGMAATPVGTLALLILLDQAPRNLFRNSARAFATDPDARLVARAALEAGFDQRVPKAMRGFFYLPFMHSEDPADQELCVALYEVLGEPNSLAYARIHAEIIERFGRFPHRNPVLGRTTTAAERRFLAEGGFAG